MRFNFTETFNKRKEEKIKLINGMQGLVDDLRVHSEKVNITDDQAKADIEDLNTLCTEKINIIKNFNVEINTNVYQEEIENFNLSYSFFQIYFCKIKLYGNFISLGRILFSFFNEIAENFNIDNDVNNHEQSLRDLIYLYSKCDELAQKINALKVADDIGIWNEIGKYDLIYHECCKIYQRIELHDNIVILHHEIGELKSKIDTNIDFPENISLLRDDSYWKAFIDNNFDNYSVFIIENELGKRRDKLSDMYIDRDEFEKFLHNPGVGYDEENKEFIESISEMYNEADVVFQEMQERINLSLSEEKKSISSFKI